VCRCTAALACLSLNALGASDIAMVAMHNSKTGLSCPDWHGLNAPDKVVYV